MSHRLPRLLLVVVPAVLALGVGVAGAAPGRTPATPSAHQTTVTLPLDAAAYYWREQSESVPVVGVAPPSAPDPSVPAGDVAVAALNDTSGKPEKEAYLRLDTGTLVSGTPTSVLLVVPLDPAPGAGQAYDTTAPPSVLACAVAGAFNDSTGAASFETKPKDDCSAKAVGRFDPARSQWTFDITPIANRWVSVGFNTGVALLPADPAATVPFQYVFGPRKHIHAIARLGSLPAQIGQGVPTPLGPAAPAAPVAANPPPALPQAPAAALATTTPQQPLVAPRTPVSPRLTPAAFGSRAEWHLPVLGVLGAIALLVLCSLVTGANRRNKPRIV